MSYTEKQKHEALTVYDETGSVTRTIAILEYPTRQTLYQWIAERNCLPKEKPDTHSPNTPVHPRHPSLEVKLDAIKRCFEDGEDVKSVAEDIGYSRPSIYGWRRKYLQEGMTALMNSRDIPRGGIPEGEVAAYEKEIRELKAQVHDMQMRMDIMQETINVLKKDPGTDLNTLKNREKAEVVGALKDKYPLPDLLDATGLSRSSYYYQRKAMSAPDKYQSLRARIKELFEENRCCYGYRRIHALLQQDDVCVSEKIIRRIMREEGLIIPNRRHRKYSSYKGEITPAVPNVIERDFHSDRPNEKWLTDITEFSIPAGKVYLSPIIDCFDGMPVSWRLDTSPNAGLVNSMLDAAVVKLKDDEHPIIHSDRGCHYRWPGWINRMEKAGLTRSMSKKGCSPDNSACEGFFGRLKNEMFYGVSWKNVSIEDFIKEVDDYIRWYRDTRIKMSLGGMSPLQYRRNLGMAA